MINDDGLNSQSEQNSVNNNDTHATDTGALNTLSSTEQSLDQSATIRSITGKHSATAGFSTIDHQSTIDQPGMVDKHSTINDYSTINDQATVGGNSTVTSVSNVESHNTVDSMTTVAQDSPVNESPTVQQTADQDGMVTTVDISNRPEAVKIKPKTKKRAHKDQPMPEKIEQYRILTKLGEGGMGVVYKAYDEKLDRNVALKIIRSREAESIERFLREARLQAHLNHENICEIYEVGELEHQFYIAMQFIDGKNLRAAEKELNTEQKIQIMIKASQAVHAAHLKGLIHRDIKPDNIMVERQENGDWKPYVVDFGIAREQASSGNTITGTVMGTPQFMSPEQARGEVHKLDRRADVYSLGATLYWLIANKQLFDASSVAEVLMKVINDEVMTLRRVKPEISSDLETIVMKCLDKEPSRRYATAHALADDLQSYLDGEPISARPVTLSYRAWRLARKNRVATTTLLISSLIIFIAIGFSIRTYLRSTKQAELAQQLGQEIERIDSIIRQARLLPLHNTAREKQIVIARLKRIQQLIDSNSEVAFGPGNYALGRAMMQLGRHNEALDHLKKSWQSGYEKPEVAYWLGLASGEIYIRQLTALDQITNNSQRELRRKEIERDYREPALRYLNLGRNSISEDAAEYGEALIAFYESRWPEALQKAAIAFNKTPWRYEAKKLEGDIYIAIAEEKRAQANIEAALVEFQHAAEPYRIAMEMGSSDEEVYRGECQRQLGILGAENARGKMQPQLVQNVCDACNKALQVEPQDINAYYSMATAYYLLADVQIYQDTDPLPSINSAIELVNKALVLYPNSDVFYALLTEIYWRRSDYEKNRGIDPRPTLAQSIASGQRALELNPASIDTLVSLASCYWVLGIYQEKLDLNAALSSYEKGIAATDKALQARNQDGFAYTMRGNLYMNFASVAASLGNDPSAYYEKASQNYEQAIKYTPSYISGFYNHAVLLTNLSLYQMAHGIDPQPALDRAIAVCERSQKLDPNYTANVLGIAYQQKAIDQFLHGQDPDAALQRSITNFQSTIKIYPTYPESYFQFAITYNQLAEYQWTQGIDPNRSLQLARETIERGLKINANEANFYFNLVNNSLLTARVDLAANKNVLPLLAKAREEFNKGSKLDLSHQQMALQLSIERLSAQAAIMAQRSPVEIFDNVKKLWQQASDQQRKDADILLEMAYLQYWQAKWQHQQRESIEPLIKQGLEYLNKAKEINGRDSRIILLMGAMNSLAADSGIDATASRERAKQAIEQSIAINKFLKMELLELELK